MKLKELTLMLLSTLALLVGLSSCIGTEEPTSENPSFSGKEVTTAMMVQVTESAAAQACKIKMRAISPNTGSSPKFSYDAEQIEYNSSVQTFQVPLTISWSAKTTELSSTRGICEMSGILTVNLSQRNQEVITATFIPHSSNDWLKSCLGYYGTSVATAQKPITFNAYR